MRTKDAPPKSYWYWAAIVALLCGAFLRWASLGPMSTMLHYDEAWNGIDALQLWREPRLTVFLPNNFGRESGWIYWLVPYVAAFGSRPFALRLAATVTGILSLAAVYRVAHVLWGSRRAFWSCAVLAVLYWHVHLSLLALRANLYLLAGALVTGQCIVAYHKNSLRAWIVAGVGMGLMAYTYFASFAWIGYLGILGLWIAYRDPQRRRRILLALCLALIVALPMMAHFVLVPEQLDRVATVYTLNFAGPFWNIWRWFKAWFIQGDQDHEFNLSGRTILGPLTFVFAALGLYTLFRRSRKAPDGLFLLGLGVATCLPSIFSNPAPHHLRGLGMTLPVALVLGAGADTLWEYARGFLTQPLRPSERQRPLWESARGLLGAGLVKWLPIAFLLPVAARTYYDFHVTWIHHPDTFIVMEQHINQAVTFVRDTTPDDVYVYFTPFTTGHPVITFRSGDLGQRPIGAFDSHQCLVLSDHAATYVSLTMYEPSFRSNLAQWADVTAIYTDANGTQSPRYTIFAAQPHTLTSYGTARFGDALEVQLLQPISDTVHPGETVRMVLGNRALRTLDFSPSVFIHLYGDPTPYEGGQLWAQGDSNLCATYPSQLWRSEETIIQAFDLALPPDLPPGTYSVAMGVYPFPNGARLPITLDDGPLAQDYLVIHELQVVE